MHIGTLFTQGHTQPIADAAMSYARAGLPIFACAPQGKRPLTPNGLLDATTDADQVMGWWSRWPEANIGLATGGHGYDVIDVDLRPTGSGFDALQRARQAEMVDGWVCEVRTPSGGVHLYYPARPERPQRSWADTTAHLDFRGTGGYVITPPSRIPQDDGSLATYRPITQNRNGWPVDSAALRALLRPPRAARRPASSVVSGGRGERIAVWLSTRPEGARNNALFWAACRYAEDAISQTDAQQRLGVAAEQAGLEPAEIAATIRSAYRSTNALVARPLTMTRTAAGRTL